MPYYQRPPLPRRAACAWVEGEGSPVTVATAGLDELGAGHKTEELALDLFASSAYAPSRKMVLSDLLDTVGRRPFAPSGFAGAEKTVDSLREVTVLRNVLASLEEVRCADISSDLLRDWSMPVSL